MGTYTVCIRPSTFLLHTLQPTDLKKAHTASGGKPRALTIDPTDCHSNKTVTTTRNIKEKI
ncbi:mCG148070 [Mus musculus]|nr:mCG148070 [Mus musculus]